MSCEKKFWGIQILPNDLIHHQGQSVIHYFFYDISIWISKHSFLYTQCVSGSYILFYVNRTLYIHTGSCPVAWLYNSYAFQKSKNSMGGKTEQHPIPFTSMPSVSILGWCYRTKELNTCVHEKEHIWKGVCWSIMKIVWHYSNCSEALYLYLPDNAMFTLLCTLRTKGGGKNFLHGLNVVYFVKNKK